MEAWRPKTETRLLRLNGRKPRLYLEVSDRIINMTPATLFLYHIIDLREMERTTEMGIGFMRRSVMPYATVTVTAQAGGSVSGGVSL